MPQVVTKLSKETVKTMCHHYQDYFTSTPQGAIFRAKTVNAVITAYHSGKVLFQGKDPSKEASKWGNASISPDTSKKVKPQAHAYKPPQSLFTSAHLGSDEAGTGDYFGPITVACVFVKQDQISALKQIGVQDSKNLSDQAIKQIAEKLLQMDITYSSVVLHNDKYNALKNKGWSQGKMKAMLHHYAIENVQKKCHSHTYTGILIDQFCEPAVYKRHLKQEGETLRANTYFMTKAESYSIAVAAASILARTRFLQEMDQLSHEVGIILPKGASAKVDQTIATIIRQNGHSPLQTCAKVHFANTQKAETYL